MENRSRRKKTIYNSDNTIVGVICSFQDYTQEKIVDAGRFILDKQKYFNGRRKTNQFCYTVGNINSNHQFTPKQLQCIFYLTRYISAKHLARKLNISFRTAESYISHLKDKLNCNSKYELIEKLIHLGYQNMIPNSLLI